MSSTKYSNPRIRILLSEGSSTNVRETITALGPSGYIIDICDPNPYCMGRYSSYIHKVFKSPISGEDPVGYLNFVINLIKEQGYDVLFPSHEQAFLFAWAKEYLLPLVGIAVSDFQAFQRVQTKSAFMHFLDEIDLPHPPTRFAKNWDEIEDAVSSFGYSCFIKSNYGTASTGVWRVKCEKDLQILKESQNYREIMSGQDELIVQETSHGVFEQLHSIFDCGRLVAIHCTRRLREGQGGGAAVKIGVDRPVVKKNLEKIGKAIKWHGSLSIDYFYNEQDGIAYYIDANPRITEPMNSVVNGINLAEMQVDLSLGRCIQTNNNDLISKKSHSAIQALLAAARERSSRVDVLKEFCMVAARKGIYQNSEEGMTPIVKDFPSILPLGSVLLQLLYNPQSGYSLAQKTVANYSLGPAISQISAKNLVYNVTGIR